MTQFCPVCHGNIKLQPIGFFIDTNRNNLDQARAAVAGTFPSDLMLNYRFVSEFSKGEPRSVVLGDRVDVEQLARIICA